MLQHHAPTLSHGVARGQRLAGKLGDKAENTVINTATNGDRGDELAAGVCLSERRDRVTANLLCNVFLQHKSQTVAHTQTVKWYGKGPCGTQEQSRSKKELRIFGGFAVRGVTTECFVYEVRLQAAYGPQWCQTCAVLANCTTASENSIRELKCSG